MSELTTQTLQTSRPHPRPSDDAGFSLIEILVAGALLTFIMGGLLTVFSSGQDSFEAQQAIMEMRQGGRVAMDQLVRETRLAGYGLENVPEALFVADVDTIQFAADVDDGDPAPPCGAAFETATDGGVERVTYELANGQLLRSVECWDGSSWTAEITDQLLAESLVDGQTLFRYFDGDGTELVPGAGGLSAAQRDEVRMVSLSVDMLDDTRTQRGVGDPHTNFQIDGRVELHNVDR